MVFAATIKKYRACLPVIAAAGLLSVFLVRELFYISYSSATFDEGYYITYGYSLLKTGSHRLSGDKSSLAPLLAGLPLLAARVPFDESNSSWTRCEQQPDPGNLFKAAADFIYQNAVSADMLLFHARLSFIFLAMALGLGVCFWSARANNAPAAGLVSLFLFTTCPNILAHSGLATEDLAFSLFSFLTVYSYYRYSRSGGRAELLSTGLFLGLALNTKYSAILLLPALAGACLFECALRKNGKETKKQIMSLGAVFALAALVIAAFYGFSDMRVFWTGLKKTVLNVDSSQMSFMNGQYSLTGFRTYFLYAILVKTPLPVFICAVMAAAVRFKTHRLYRADTFHLVLFPAILLLAASFSGFNIGLRHVLPVYPFLFVFCGAAGEGFNGKLRSAAFGAVLVWQAWTTAQLHPHYLSYFNELAGGPARGHERLLDSNLDWGQDLKGLKNYLNAQGVSDLVLSYFGATVPGYLGRDFQNMFSTIPGDKAHINPPAPAKEYLAVSATNFHGVYLREFGKHMFYWLGGKEPLAVIGNSIRVYDITSDPRAHEHMANVYFMTGYPRHAERECRRALLLDPDSRMAEFLLALVFIKEKAGERSGLELMKKYLKKNGAAAPAVLPEFIPSGLFRDRYSRIFAYAAQKFLAAKNPKEAETMASLSERIRSYNPGTGKDHDAR